MRARGKGESYQDNYTKMTNLKFVFTICKAAKREYTMGSPRIFVSHSSKDDAFGVRLVEDLRRVLGDESAVWYDSRGGLHGGDSWWGRIVEEITARNIFLIVLSPDSVTSDWVKDELALAWRLKNSTKRMQIIPLLYRACEVRGDLQTLQIISFLSPKSYEAAFNELLLTLELSQSSRAMTAMSQVTFQDYQRPIALNLSPTPTRVSLGRMIFSIMGVIWMGVGCILAIQSLIFTSLRLFPAGVANVFIGLMIFFLARMRKSSLPLSITGIFVGATGILSGIGIMIIAANFPNVIINEVSGGLESGTVMLIVGVIILGSYALSVIRR
jgi:TIR domain